MAPVLTAASPAAPAKPRAFVGEERLSSRIVTVPAHPGEAGLTLLGVSAGGVAVAQDSASSGGLGVQRIYTGAEGGELTRRPALENGPVEMTAQSVYGVYSGSVAWSAWSVGNFHSYDMHLMDVRTGKDTFVGSMPPPAAFTGDSWLSGATVAPYDPPPHKLQRYTIHRRVRADRDESLTVSDVTPVIGDVDAVEADATSALMQSSHWSDPQEDGPRRHNLDLVDLVSGAKEPLVVNSSTDIAGIALSPDTIAWTTGPARPTARSPLLIHQRARSGGPTTTFTETDPNAHARPFHPEDPADSDNLDDVGPVQLAISHGQVGYLVLDPAGTVLRLVTGATARDLPVPAGSSGLTAVGDRFVTAAGGSPAVAGVYGIDPTTSVVTRTATVPVRDYSYDAAAFAGSKLYYADESPGGAGMSLWQRAVTGPATQGGPVGLSPESLLTARPAISLDDFPDRDHAISFSAARGAIRPAGTRVTQLLDRDSITGVVVATGPPTVSGPYTLLDGSVYRPDGARVSSAKPPRPYAVTDYDDNGDAVFGSRVIYGGTRALPGKGDPRRMEIWTDDVEHPHRVRLAQQRSPSCWQLHVAIWGDWVAWSNCAGSQVTVRNLRTKVNRVVTVTPKRSDDLNQVVLGEGVLAWQRDGAATRVLDLTRKRSRPVLLAGQARRILLDDHLIARELPDGDGALTLDVQALPFRPPYRPRLIGTLADPAFDPAGDARFATWTPQFDVSKPLRSATLTINPADGGPVVRTLTSSSPDGSIRDLSWDGRATDGAAAPPGTYRWTLKAQAADGDGALVGPQGETTVGGTVRITRQ